MLAIALTTLYRSEQIVVTPINAIAPLSLLPPSTWYHWQQTGPVQTQQKIKQKSPAWRESGKIAKSNQTEEVRRSQHNTLI